MACELRIAAGGLGTVAPLLTLLRRASALLPRLADLTLCRSIQLLVLLARGDAAKDLEIPGAARPAHRAPPTELTTSV